MKLAVCNWSRMASGLLLSLILKL
uniref:Uncharacterized protein n=1 Tax=Rhizophora mucronata TaxID=61149 RepID=A0A2P2PNZ9_RHIMU